MATTSKSTTPKKVPSKQSPSVSLLPEEFMAAPKPKPWTPHDYQKKAIKFMIERMAAALFLDPGLGKTSICLGAFKILKKQGMVQKAYIVAPLRVCYSVWPREIEKWADFNGLKVEVLHGPDKEEALKREADIYVINPEGLEWLFGVKKVRSERTGKVSVTHDTKRVKSLKLEDAMLIVDESTKFKHSGSQRFKILRPILPRFRRRYILTGTPAPNGLMDLFGQVYILDLGKSLGQFITNYRNTFFDATGFGGFEWVPKPDTPKKIETLLKPLALRMEARDYLELPEEVVNPIYVDLPADAMRVYKEMEVEMLAMLEGQEVVTAVSAGAASNKCRQIANGGIYREDYIRAQAKCRSERWLDLHTAKIDATVDLVEELNGKPVLIAYDFEHDLHRLLKAFGKDTPYIGGGVSGAKAAAIECAWNRGEIPILLGHPAAMGHGLNLQEAGQHIIWHSLTYDLELYDQFIKRVLRQGNKHSRVFIHQLVARGTVDELILLALGDKNHTQQTFLKALKGYAKLKRSA